MSENVNILPFAFAKQHGVILLQKDNAAHLLCLPKVNASTLLEVQRVVGGNFTTEQINSDAFEQQLVDCYQQNSSQARTMMENIGNEMDFYSLSADLPDSEDLLDTDDDAPIIRMINAMLSEAIKAESSDIHIETFERYMTIRFRVDGVLREILRPQRKLAPLLVSRIKVMSKMDIAEKRVPQDGRIALRIGGRSIDVRVSTMPANHGERVVMRLLDKNNARLELAQLGMTKANRDHIAKLIQSPHGIILVTGPTGSGKSTTLYAALSQINTKDRNILTVEDPIEYDIEGIGQTQVNNKVDMTFSRGLRAILRQDPDVVMVGEIRDTETAQIAVQASLTGHLVMSTLHTNTAIGAVTRLQDMHVEPFLLSTSLLAVLAQRLVRTLCKECKEKDVLSSVRASEVGLPENSVVYRACGCEACNESGYRGRMGIHELLIIDDNVRSAIHRNDSEMEIEAIIRDYTPSIRQDGLDKVLMGHTTLEEVMRVTKDE